MHEAAYAGHDTIVKLLVAAGGNNLACNSVSCACRMLFGLQFVPNCSTQAQSVRDSLSESPHTVSQRPFRLTDTCQWHIASDSHESNRNLYFNWGSHDSVASVMQSIEEKPLSLDHPQTKLLSEIVVTIVVTNQWHLMIHSGVGTSRVPEQSCRPCSSAACVSESHKVTDIMCYISGAL